MTANELYESCINARIEWRHILEAGFDRDGSTVAWHNYEESPRLEDPTVLEVQQLARDRQYSFRCIEDGAIMQLRYTYDGRGRKLRFANLAYFGNEAIIQPDDLSDQTYEAYMNGSISLTEIEQASSPEDLAAFLELEKRIQQAKGTPVPWLRIDFDPRPTSKGFLHAACHVHFYRGDVRLGLSQVPSPEQFIEMVMSLFYSTQYRAKRLNKSGELVDERILRRIFASSPTCESWDDPAELVPRLVLPRVPAP